MFDTVERIRDGLAEVVAGVDPGTLDGRRARRLFDSAVEIKRLAGSLELLVAGRLEATRGWRGDGDRSMAHFVARKTGTSVGQAVSVLKTARQLDPDGVTADALRAGEISTQHAAEITDACTTDPHTEKELVDRAAHTSFQELRDECRRVKSAARSDEVAHDDAIRRSRYLRTWTDHDGAGRGEWKLTPEAQATLVARLDAEAELAAKDAKDADAPIEARHRYLADALERLATTGRDGEQTASHVVLHLNLDHSAARRGHAEPGETCELAGVGPISVASALAMSTDALAYAVVRDGTNVTHVSRLGRSIPKALRVALEARDQICPVPHCDVDHDWRSITSKPSTTTGPPASRTASARASTTTTSAPTRAGASNANPTATGNSSHPRVATAHHPTTCNSRSDGPISQRSRAIRSVGGSSAASGCKAHAIASTPSTSRGPGREK